MGVQVIATSSYLPTSVITNDDWAKRVDTSDEWIVKRTGIKTRYWAKEQTTSELATIAAKRLVEKSNISPESIEFIIVATMTPDAASPSCASLDKEQSEQRMHSHLISVLLVADLSLPYQQV